MGVRRLLVVLAVAVAGFMAPVAASATTPQDDLPPVLVGTACAATTPVAVWAIKAALLEADSAELAGEVYRAVLADDPTNVCAVEGLGRLPAAAAAQAEKAASKVEEKKTGT